MLIRSQATTLLQIFLSYFEKYVSSRRRFPRGTLSVNGLIFGLSHVLKPLSHDGATVRELDNPGK